MHRRTSSLAVPTLILGSVLPAAVAQSDRAPLATANRYTDTILAASNADYQPLNIIDPLLGNGWGLAIRPPGAGGHFWISNFNTGTTTTYVGDVHKPDGTFIPLFQDELMQVRIPIGAGRRVNGEPTAPISQPTGQVFNHSSKDFVVSGEGITAASKFIFVTAEGTISGWTEARDPETGELKRQLASVITIDDSHAYDDDRLRYTGCAVTDFPENNRLYVTNFIENRVEVFDHEWRRVEMPEGAFRLPDQPEWYHMWNIQYFRTGPDGEGRLWGVFALMEEPWEEDPGIGTVAEFDLEGNYIRRLEIALDTDPYADSELRAPWGLAIAPDNFGPLSGCMIVANFADGTLPAFNLQTGKFVDYVRDNNGEVLSVDGVWGLLFGNGVALGDTNAMYYAAGPFSEFDGTFGSIRYTPDTCPTIEQQPRSVTLAPGARTATIEIKAPSPVRCTYQWQAEFSPGIWTDLTSGPLSAGSPTAVRGADSTRLRFSGVGPDAAIRYRCQITNACGSIASEPASIILSESP